MSRTWLEVGLQSINQSKTSDSQAKFSQRKRERERSLFDHDLKLKVLWGGPGFEAIWKQTQVLALLWTVFAVDFPSEGAKWMIEFRQTFPARTWATNPTRTIFNTPIVWHQICSCLSCIHHGFWVGFLHLMVTESGHRSLVIFLLLHTSTLIC